MNKEYAARIKKLSDLLIEEGLLESQASEINERLESIGYEIDPITKELFGKYKGEMTTEDWREFFKMEQDLLVFTDLQLDDVQLSTKGMPLTRDLAIQFAKHEICLACGLDGSLQCSECTKKVPESVIQDMLATANSAPIRGKADSETKTPAHRVGSGSILKDK